MAEYVLITDEKSTFNGRVFEKIDETPTKIGVNIDGINAWFEKEVIRNMGPGYKPEEAGIPEAFDAGDQMYLPIVDKSGDDVDNWAKNPMTVAMVKESDELRAINKALKNAKERLIQENDELIDSLNKAGETTLEQFNTIQTLEAERDEYKSLNEFHREQVEIGNERREKMKKTVESLHIQMDEKNKKMTRMAERATKAEEELERYKRIVDALTKRTF